MEAALQLKGSLADRHYLFLALIEAVCKTGDEVRVMALCRQHCAEMPQLAPALRQEDKRMGSKGQLPNIPSFERLARYHLRQEELERAEDVCQQAIAHGVGWEDAEGRYSRLLAKIQSKRKRSREKRRPKE